MKHYAFLPLHFLKFWYIESPVELVRFFYTLTKAFLQLFSLPLFLRTFFKPLKGEYREGLVRFSIAMGIGVKSLFIFVDLLLLFFLLLLEVGIFLGFLGFPLLTIVLLFI